MARKRKPVLTSEGETARNRGLPGPGRMQHLTLLSPDELVDRVHRSIHRLYDGRPPDHGPGYWDVGLALVLHRLAVLENEIVPRLRALVKAGRMRPFEWVEASVGENTLLLHIRKLEDMLGIREK